MSNRLSFAHVAPRREPHEWLPAPRHGLARRALDWLNSFVETDASDLPPVMRRDLGLPLGASPAFVYEVERSRVRL
jgi:hypothetical protein